MSDFRETTIRVNRVERTIRTELGGKIRTVKQLEAAHTKNVKAAIIEMRRENVPAYRAAVEDALVAAESKRGDWFAGQALKDAHAILRRAERGTVIGHGATYDVAAARRPWPKVRYTEEIPSYLVEVEPGHYATEEAAEQLTLV